MNASSILSACLLMSVCGLYAENEVPKRNLGSAEVDVPRISAFRALEVVIKQYGEGYGARIARIEGFLGKDQPEEWVIYSYDYQYDNRISRFMVRGGKVVEAQLLGVAESQVLAAPKFSATTDLLDSSEIFAFVEAAARQAKTGFDSADYLLFYDEDAEVPVYRIGLRNRDGAFVGGLKLAAQSELHGEEYWSDWPGSEDSAERAESDARRATKEVKDFFKGFGRNVRDVFRDP